jgi:hypothetical protein
MAQTKIVNRCEPPGFEEQLPFGWYLEALDVGLQPESQVGVQILIGNGQKILPVHLAEERHHSRSVQGLLVTAEQRE